MGLLSMTLIGEVHSESYYSRMHKMHKMHKMDVTLAELAVVTQASTAWATAMEMLRNAHQDATDSVLLELTVQVT